MEFSFTPQAWLLAGLIFVLRLANQSIDTVRIVMMLRGRKGLAWMLGFIESLIFVVTLLYVISDLSNILNILAYAGGFATGIVLGMWLEDRMAIGFTQIRIVSPKRGVAVAQRLRAEGYAVTEVPARGKDGMVSLIEADVRRKNVKEVRALVQDVDAEAFMTTTDVHPLWRGFWRA